MSAYRNIKNKIKTYLKRYVKMKSSPHIIALSFAIGSFIAIIPLFGFGIIIGLLVAFTFKKLNKIALMSAFVVWNPFLTIPVITLSYKIGDILFEGLEVVKYEMMFFNNLFTFTRRFLVGNIMLNLSFSFISYLFLRWIILLYKLRRLNRIKRLSSKTSNHF